MDTVFPLEPVTLGATVPEILHSAGGSAIARAEEFFLAHIETQTPVLPTSAR